jgi:hypothetical protein
MFYGLIVRMYYAPDEHPPPHFHVYYAEFKATIGIDSAEVMNGELDMTPYLDFGVFTRLKNKDNFVQVRVAFDTIEWPCGVDLDPEFVYQKTERKR